MTPPILVAVDPHRDDPAPLVLGLRLARLAGAPLLLCATYPTRQADRVHPELAAALRTSAEDALSRAAAELADAPGATPPLELRAVATTGSPSRALHDLAEAEGPLLMVLGSSTRGQIGRVSPGAVTDRLLRGAPCAVAVAPRGLSLAAAGERWLRVGAAYLDSPDAQVALHAAAAIAGASAAYLRLLVVMPAAEPYVTLAPGSRRWSTSRPAGPTRRSSSTTAWRPPGTAWRPARCWTASRPPRSPPSRPCSTCWSAARAATARCARCCWAARRTRSCAARPARARRPARGRGAPGGRVRRVGRRADRSAVMNAVQQVVIAGGGVGALEAALALRALAGDRVAVTMLAPELEFTYRPLSVGEPFGLGHATRYELAGDRGRPGFAVVRDAIAAVEPEAHTLDHPRRRARSLRPARAGAGRDRRGRRSPARSRSAARSDAAGSRRACTGSARAAASCSPCRRFRLDAAGLRARAAHGALGARAASAGSSRRSPRPRRVRSRCSAARRAPRSRPCSTTPAWRSAEESRRATSSTARSSSAADAAAARPTSSSRCLARRPSLAGCRATRAASSMSTATAACSASRTSTRWAT